MKAEGLQLASMSAEVWRGSGIGDLRAGQPVKPGCTIGTYCLAQLIDSACWLSNPGFEWKPTSEAPGKRIQSAITCTRLIPLSLLRSSTLLLPSCPQQPTASHHVGSRQGKDCQEVRQPVLKGRPAVPRRPCRTVRRLDRMASLWPAIRSTRCYCLCYLSHVSACAPCS